jgi:hypothetical protein
MEMKPIAVRGSRLSLTCERSRDTEDVDGPVTIELLTVVEVADDGLVHDTVSFDPNDIDAAFEELDARYLAGEAAEFAHTWSVVAAAYAALNRHELAQTTPDWVNIDHRRGTAFAPGDMTAMIRASWDLTPDLNFYIETVHRLSNLGGVVTHAEQGTSQDGFDAEWRAINVFTVEGNRISRCETFEEADIDAALARFEELSRPGPRLENAASRLYDRFNTLLAARDWDAMGEMVTDDVCDDDRRRVVSGGIQRGRDAQMANLRAVADVGVENFESIVIATRGERVALTRSRVSGGGQPAEAFALEMLTVIEIDTDNRIAAGVNFDLQDIAAAFEELDARYLAGEAAANSRAWSVIARTYATFNRHELPPTTPDWVNVDHRRATSFAPGDTTAYLRATWDIAPDINIYIEAVHRLSDVGAVITHAAHGTSREGFDAEWREVTVFRVDGDLVNRAEIFDEADIDAALSKFDELNRAVPRLKNMANQVTERFWAHFAARDWAALADVTADDIFTEDHRRVVNAGARHGRDADLANLRAMAELNGNATSTAIAIRGERLVLSRLLMLAYSGEGAEAFRAEGLGLTEINADNRVAARVVFDIEDIDAAFEELDSRYLAGEAAAHAHTWSLVAQTYARLNRGELPATTPDWVTIDHRRVTTFAPGDLTTYLGATWDITPNAAWYVEAVHRLNNLGTVITHIARGTSPDGADAERREIVVVTLDGDLFSRCEMFDEADLEAALATFDELNQPVPQLENAATRNWARLVETFNSRDLNGLIALAAADACYEDRRRGLRDEGLARPEVARAFFEAAPSSWRMEAEAVAIRGLRFSLTRVRFRDTGDANRPITTELLSVTEVGDGDLIRNTVSFDPDDINGAMDELTARWIASGEVAHPGVIEAGRRLNEAANRHDWDEISRHLAGASYVGHRQLGSEGADTADYLSSIRMFASLVPDLWSEAADVLAHSATGLVAYMVLKGTSTDGVAIEIPHIHLVLLDGDRVTHFETFDPEQRDQALARFEAVNS